MKPVRIGCSGWQFKSWRECFYPKGLGQSRWLRHYSTATSRTAQGSHTS